MGSFLDYNDKRSLPLVSGCLVTTLTMIVGVFLCIASLGAAIDGACVRDAGRWLVDYPNSELVSQEHSFVRPFGLGETTRILYSPDPVGEVRLWYNRHNTELSAQGYSRGGQGRMISRASPATDGEGTQIMLYLDCASTAFFGG